MKNKLEKIKTLASECKHIAKEKAEQSEDDTNTMMLWLNYKIELADIEYRMKDMLKYLPKE